MQTKLIHGDCLECMGDIPDKSVDMILCDMPYGTTRNIWDTVIPLDRLWREYNRICKPDAAMVLFSQQPFASCLAASNPKMFRYEWIWEKAQGTGHLNANKMPMKAHENVLVFYRSVPTYNPQMRTGFTSYECKSGRGSTNYGQQRSTITVSHGERYPIDVLRYSNEKGLHPTQKPVALLEYLINTYTNKGETVLDSCMGSGSTGVACINTGRRFIGIEIDDNYFNIAKERIANANNT